MNRFNVVMTIIAAIVGLILLIVVVGQKRLTPKSPAAGEPITEKLKFCSEAP